MKRIKWLVGLVLALLLVVMPSVTAQATGVQPDAPKLKSITYKEKKNQIIVKWVKNKSVKGHEVYRATEEEGDYILIASLKGKKTSYKDKTAEEGYTYYYKIRSYVKTNGQTVYSAYSEVESVTISGEKETEVQTPELILDENTQELILFHAPLSDKSGEINYFYYLDGTEETRGPVFERGLSHDFGSLYDIPNKCGFVIYQFNQEGNYTVVLKICARDAETGEELSMEERSYDFQYVPQEDHPENPPQDTFDPNDPNFKLEVPNYKLTFDRRLKDVLLENAPLTDETGRVRYHYTVDCYDSKGNHVMGCGLNAQNSRYEYADTRSLLAFTIAQEGVYTVKANVEAEDTVTGERLRGEKQTIQVEYPIPLGGDTVGKDIPNFKVVVPDIKVSFDEAAQQLVIENAPMMDETGRVFYTYFGKGYGGPNGYGCGFSYYSRYNCRFDLDSDRLKIDWQNETYRFSYFGDPEDAVGFYTMQVWVIAEDTVTGKSYTGEKKSIKFTFR